MVRKPKPGYLRRKSLYEITLEGIMIAIQAEHRKKKKKMPSRRTLRRLAEERLDAIRI